MEFQISVSAKVRSDMRTLLREAESRGHGPAVRAAMRALEERMRKAPARHGDPAYMLPSGRGMVYRDMQGVVCVYYAVYEAESIVWVASVTRVSFAEE